MMYFLLLLNFCLGWLNCLLCGRLWNESKAIGGMKRLLSWCVAIFATLDFAVGFCYIADAALRLNGQQHVCGASLGLFILMASLLGGALLTFALVRKYASTERPKSVAVFA